MRRKACVPDLRLKRDSLGRRASRDDASRISCRTVIRDLVPKLTLTQTRLGLGLGLGWVKVRVRVTVKVSVRVRVPQAPLVG